VLIRAAKADDAREPKLLAALRASLPAIERCYQGELLRTPTLGGTLDLKLRITALGAIDLAAPQDESTLASAEVAGCALRTIRSVTVGQGRNTANGAASLDFFVAR
jgi:hypothetical protein